MPLTAIQKNVLKLLAAHRRPESHLAGGTAINRSSASPRFSADIDLFHDAVDNVRETAEADTILLAQYGYEVEWLDRQPSMQRANVMLDEQCLKVEWCHDSAFRFFPVQSDPEIGYCLHPADLATNKVLALADRAEIRDFIDIVFLHESYLSLGAICWAACGKDQGFTPISLLDFAKRHMRFRDEDLAKENLARPLTLIGLKQAWLEAVDQAEQLIRQLPLTEVGSLYLTPDFAPVTPVADSPDFRQLIRHYGSIRGAWPVLA